VRYEAELTGDKIQSEKALVDYIHYKDFGHNVANTWADVWLVWRRVYKSRAEAKKRFPKYAEKLSYTAKTASDDDKELGEHKACIYEILDKTLNKTCFISKDCPEVLEDGPPPISFRDFFPCPEPCYGSKTSKSLFPTPDYRYYQDQAQEIDDLTEKIANLTDYLMMRAFVPAGPSGDGADSVRIMIQNLQSDITSNKSIFVPVESWAGFAEKGGAKGLMDWLPVDMVIQALQGAIEARNQLVQDVYQITGIADILRGQTDPDETLGAQQLKAQTGARRVKNSKDDVARFCRDIGQLVAEVIAEQFQPQTIADMSGYAYVPAPPVQPMMPQQPGMPGQQPMQQPVQPPSGKSFDDKVLQLLRDDRMRGFLIDIETDSTIQPDEDAEKQRRTEFITATGGFLQQASEMMAGAPALAPMVSEMLLFGVRGFRVGRQMEDVIESTLKNVAQELQQRQQQPDPKVQAEQMKAQALQAETQADMQAAQEKHQLELQKIQVQAQADMQMMQAEIQALYEKLGIEREQMQLEAQADRQRLAMQAASDQQKMAVQQQTHEMQLDAAQQQHALGQEAAEHKHAIGIDMLKQKAKSATSATA